MQRAAGIRPLLLADKADYTLGYAAEEKRAKRAADCHQAYLALVERCAAETEEPDVRAVLNFLHNDPLGQIQPGESFDPSGIMTFRVEDPEPSSTTPQSKRSGHRPTPTPTPGPCSAWCAGTGVRCWTGSKPR